jgi:hypothetical protein
MTNGAIGTGLIAATMTPDVGNPLVNLGVGAGAGALAAGVHKFVTYDSKKPETKSLFNPEGQNRNLGRQFKKVRN